MTDNNGWYSFAERRPTKEDADAFELVTHTDGERQWTRSWDSEPVRATHWMPFRPPAKEPSEGEKARTDMKEIGWDRFHQDVMANFIRAIVKEGGK